jgi:hypothetical protein
VTYCALAPPWDPPPPPPLIMTVRREGGGGIAGEDQSSGVLDSEGKVACGYKAPSILLYNTVLLHNCGLCNGCITKRI